MGLKVALITAGGSGMGADSARALAEDGFEVGVLSSSGKGEALGKELGGIGVTGSNQNSEDLQGLVDQAMARWGRIDVLVNSAGHGPKGPLDGLSDDDWHTGFDVYFMHAVRPARIVTPIMAGQGRGHIINISSFSAVEASVAFPTSSVARAGLSAYTKIFNDTYAARGLRMNNVLPGFINSLPEKEEIRKTIPLGRYGDSATEIAGVVRFLASDAAGYIVGQNLRVDGGITRSA